MEIKWKANAKVNLALDVLEEREDGYHEIDTVMQEISLHDVLTFETGRGGFALTCSNPHLILDDHNLVYRAWHLLKDRVKDPSVVIHIEKNIPLAAGLAGGSTDAAATLLALNRMWSLNMSKEELETLAAQLGSDVPFFLYGGTMRAQGRGECLTRLPSYAGHWLVLVNNGESISSQYVYARVPMGGSIRINTFVERLESGNPRVTDLMENQMEKVSFATMPQLMTIARELEEQGALVARMSGSGPTMFGVFENKEYAEKAKKALQDKYPTVLVVETL